MKFIEGLDQYTAIKVGDVFVVQLSKGYYPPQHLINGVEVALKQAVVDNLDCITTTPTTQSSISHYSNGKEIMSAEEYQSIFTNMSQYWDEDAEDCVFPSLEVEYELKKEQEKLKGYEKVLNITEIPPKSIKITLVGEMVDTGSDFISTSFSVGKSSFGSSGVFKVEAPILIAIDEFKKVAKDKEVDHVIPSHSGLLYAKIGGQYLFTNNDPYISDRNSYNKIFKTLDEAKEYENIIRNFIKKRVLVYCKTEELKSATAKEIFSDLNNLLSYSYGLDVKQKSDSTKNSLINKIKDIMSKIED